MSSLLHQARLVKKVFSAKKPCLGRNRKVNSLLAVSLSFTPSLFQRKGLLFKERMCEPCLNRNREGNGRPAGSRWVFFRCWWYSNHDNPSAWSRQIYAKHVFIRKIRKKSCPTLHAVLYTLSFSYTFISSIGIAVVFHKLHGEHTSNIWFKIIVVKSLKHYSWSFVIHELDFWSIKPTWKAWVIFASLFGS